MCNTSNAQAFLPQYELQQTQGVHFLCQPVCGKFNYSQSIKKKKITKDKLLLLKLMVLSILSNFHLDYTFSFVC